MYLPYHGKGECDSHGSVVKRKIQLYILDGWHAVLFNCIISFSDFYFSENHHIDNESEAAEFINSSVNESQAFLMYLSDFDHEQDCTAVSGSSKMFQFRYFYVDLSFIFQLIYMK